MGDEINKAFIFEGNNLITKKVLMKKTKKELVDLILYKKELTPNNLTIYYGEEELLSVPTEKEWKATTLSFYHKLKDIDEIAVWSKHVIDVYNKKRNSFFNKIIHWWKK